MDADKYAGRTRHDDADAGPQAVLFDMDGLLIDSEPLWFQVETDVMTRLGGTWTEADQQELLGSSLPNSVRYFLERANGARRSGPDRGVDDRRDRGQGP